jgi:hypothetical protein
MSRILPLFFNIVHNDVPYEIFQKLDTKNNGHHSKYYDRVYLCVEDLRPYDIPNKNQPIRGFICKKFSDFEFADEYYQKMPNKDKIRSAMIPICKWSPAWLDSFLVGFYLKKIFWLGRNYVRNR